MKKAGDPGSYEEDHKARETASSHERNQNELQWLSPWKPRSDMLKLWKG